MGEYRDIDNDPAACNKRISSQQENKNNGINLLVNRSERKHTDHPVELHEISKQNVTDGVVISNQRRACSISCTHAGVSICDVYTDKQKGYVHAGAVHVDTNSPMLLSRSCPYWSVLASPTMTTCLSLFGQ